MNLGQLKIFYLSSKMGSLSKAAEELNVTQPAITKGIQRLQEYYDIKLFNRFGKKLVLTDAGIALYKIAEKIFDLEIHAEATIREFLQQKQGHIRIDASESFGAYYLPPILNPVSKGHPNVRFSVNILPSNLVVENVANLNNDIGFISYPIKNEKVICREILEDHMIFVASPSHPLVKKKRLTYMDLSGQSMIIHEKGSLSFQITHDFLKKNNLLVMHLNILHLNEHDENFSQNHQRNYKYFDYKKSFFRKQNLKLGKVYLNLQNFEICYVL